MGWVEEFDGDDAEGFAFGGIDERTVPDTPEEVEEMRRRVLLAAAGIAVTGRPVDKLGELATEAGNTYLQALILYYAGRTTREHGHPNDGLKLLQLGLVRALDIPDDEPRAVVVGFTGRAAVRAAGHTDAATQRCDQGESARSRPNLSTDQLPATCGSSKDPNWRHFPLLAAHIRTTRARAQWGTAGPNYAILESPLGVVQLVVQGGVTWPRRDSDREPMA